MLFYNYEKMLFIVMVSIAGFMSAKGSADKKVIKKVETMEKKSAHHNMVSAKAKAAFYN